jgi:hypothetical protein
MEREPTAEEREKIGSATGGCKAGRGGWSREVLTPSAGDDVDFCVVAIFGCHQKDKGNKISQHLLPRKRAPLCAIA